MKILIFFLLFLMDIPNLFSSFRQISESNKWIKRGEQAFKKGNYIEAAAAYAVLTNNLDYQNENALLNLSNAYYKLANYTRAYKALEQLSQSSNHFTRSLAFQQLGSISVKQQSHKPALEYFKQALRANPDNETARYNYELISKLLANKEKKNQKNPENKQDKNKNNSQQDQNSQNQNKDSQNQNKTQKESQNPEGSPDKKDSPSAPKKPQESDIQNKEKENKDSENPEQNSADQNSDDPQESKNNQPPADDKLLKEMKMSGEKARSLLESMRQSEIKYLQQRRRQPSKAPDHSRPDW